jgi:diguanylate cyclase
LHFEAYFTDSVKNIPSLPADPMPALDSSTLILVCGWSLAAVAVGLVCGFFIGRFFTLQHESNKLREDRQNTLKALVKLMKSADQLNQDVDEHNTALASAKQEIAAMNPVDHVRLQNELILNIAKVVQSNRKLENDLVVSKYQLESQAQELDRSRREARTDALCQIGNRKAVDEYLEFMISRNRREQNGLGLMLVDVDHFKRVNDTFGHQAGDEVLTSIANVLKSCVRPGDFVGRLGGDEFVILLEGLTAENATAVGARIRGAIEGSDFFLNDQGQSTVVTLSMGLAVANEGDNATTLFERADKALYKSKELGRNRLYTLLNNDEPAVSMAIELDEPVRSYESIKAAMFSQQQS